MPGFRCDYGFNIHTHGLAFINYNCVILDTSPVHIGANAFIAPSVCISCVGHAMDAQQRAETITTSAPITLEDDVWIGANAVICGGCYHREGLYYWRWECGDPGHSRGRCCCGNTLPALKTCYGGRQDRLAYRSLLKNAGMI